MASRCAILLLAAALAVCAGMGSAVAQSAPSAGPTATDPYAAHIAEASQRFGIPEHWIRAVMAAESTGDRTALSPKGAVGLMQIMPATWSELRARHRLGNDSWHPRDNILAGAAYLREMHDRYGTIKGMLAAYNAGPARYDEHLSRGRRLPAETRAYVAALATILGDAAPLDASSRQPPPPPDWRNAPLFIVRPNNSRATVTPPSSAQSGDLFASASEQDRR